MTLTDGFSFVDVLSRLEGVAGPRPALVDPSQRISWTDMLADSGGLAATMHDHGIGLRSERSELRPWESGQSHVGLLLGNTVEHVEALLGSWLARAAPCNLNNRYTPVELAQLIGITRVDALIYDVAFATQVETVVATSDKLRFLVEVGGTESPLIEGAIPWSSAIASPPPTLAPSPDDLHLLCTGGTTGFPKVVLWRQADLLVRVAPPRLILDGAVDIDTIVSRANEYAPVGMPAGPLMHAAAQWVALGILLQGGTVVLSGRPHGFDAAEHLRLTDTEGVQLLSIVGDAYAQPLIEALDSGAPVPRSLRTITTGGMTMSPITKERLAERLPDVRIVDVLGSSETGLVGDHRHVKDEAPGPRGFGPRHGTVVLDERRRRTLEPGEDEIGWLAVAGPCPLGYLDEPTKTAETFPTIGDVRHAISGDRARIAADASIIVLGRDATTINTGGEKVYAEEVEAALRTSPLVGDVAVVGRPDQRWGSEVVAIVAPAGGEPVDLASLLRQCEGRLSRFKWPRHLVVVSEVRRLANGKLDRPWALDTALSPVGER